jgi:nicotinamidase-related amidase
MNPAFTALILIGYQNDYFSPAGVLYKVVEDSASRVLSNTLDTLKAIRDTPTTILSTPILFTPDYRELVDPIGILKIIKDSQAFREDMPGGRTIPELEAFSDRILTIPGKRGLTAFSNTALDQELRKRGITDVVLLGVVTSLCIESTGREAFEKGYRVHIVSDCTAGRTDFEQEFYCSEIFPMYADILDHRQLIAQLA